MEGSILGGEDLAVSGLRDAVMKQRSSGAVVAPMNVADAFESMRVEAVEEAGRGSSSGASAGGGGGGFVQRVRRWVVSHPRALFLFVVCAAVFAVLARLVGRSLSAVELVLGAVVAGVVGAVVDRRVMARGG